MPRTLYASRMKARTFMAFLAAVKVQQLWVVHSKFSSPLAIVWLAFRLSWVHTRCAIKCRTLPKVAQGCKQITAEEAESWLEASRRTITSSSIVSLHYQLCTVVYTSSLHASMYVKHIYLLLPPRASSKGSVHAKTFKVPPFLQRKWSRRSSSPCRLEESSVNCCCYDGWFCYAAIFNLLRSWTFPCEI